MPITLLQGPWAADPQEYGHIVQAMDRALSDLGALDSLKRPSAPARTAAPDAAVIPVLGPIARRKNWFTEYLNFPTVEGIAEQLHAANSDAKVGRVILEIDSPGGVVAGVCDLADMIRRNPKPVVAFVDGMAASAAYWLAAAAHSIITSPSGMLGSIGIVMTWRPDPGGTTHIISSQSPLKNADPKTKDGRAEHQRVIDELAAIFVSDVARYRDTTAETVLAKFGRGGLLVGQDAVSAGMADQAGTFKDALSAAPTLRFAPAPKAAISPAARMDAAIARLVLGGMDRQLATLQAARENPELVAQINHKPPPPAQRSRSSMTSPAPLMSPSERMDAAVENLVLGGMDRPLAILQAARENPELVAQINRTPPPPDDRNALAAYEAELARLVAAGTPEATAPLELARLNPQLAEAGARAALAARTRGFEING